ncbi:MAG: nickel-dependent lactate racemase [Syntrophomonadaceae bacterium]|jgi:nickel-dependent lactate racemase
MKYQLAYGSNHLTVDIPSANIKGVIEPRKIPIAVAGEELVANSIKNPIGSPTLAQIVKNKAANNAVIVVNDITRPTPYDIILPPLLTELEQAGISDENIKLVVATGIHRPHTREDNLAVFGQDVCDRYTIENHNCDENLKSLGFLSNGMELRINKTVAEADLIITTGVVGLHYFAGYSGGRKSILPGIAARELIEANHQMMTDKRACLGNYKNNPVSDIMIEAAKMAGVDFITNVVLGPAHEVALAVSGDVYEAWMQAVKYCEKVNVVDIPEKADIVIAGCGGYPKDINVYQAQKALDAAVLALKPKGTIILGAECREGLGEKTFEDWIRKAKSPQDIFSRFAEKFELGGHKAFAICRILKQASIILVSSLPDEQVKGMFLTPAHSLDEALAMAMQEHGPKATILFMPEASSLSVNIGGQE